MNARTSLLYFLSGLLFGAGLLLSGMADPARVLGFLHMAPGWDPTLAVVMGSALAVAVPGFAWLRRCGSPWLARDFAGGAQTHVDARLVTGAALFGAGWGLAGYCPGPALIAAGLGAGVGAVLFVIAMLAGAALARTLERRGVLSG